MIPPNDAWNIWKLFSLRGKVALVTGGARNLGFDMALALAEAGADVAVSSRNFTSASEAADAIRIKTRCRTLPLAFDVRDEGQVEGAIDETLRVYGRIDILVNNAGNVSSSPDNAPFEKRPAGLWQEVLDSNLTGAFFCAKHAAAKTMIPQQAGAIINIGSTAGMIGKDRRVYRGTSMGGATLDYHAAKGAVISMTRDMAVYLAPMGVRVNCISPAGFLRGQPEEFVKAYSETIPLGRMGQDGKEIKGAVVFLASEASSFMTGHNLVLDGGLTSW
jgi:NAD(P)-dependent dehydrogenase (short-subunit alcohol dehydrogenase family)